MSSNHRMFFNQSLKIDELLSGTCLAYAYLYFSYVSMFELRKPGQAIDYSGLLPLLKNFKKDKRFELHSLQDEYLINKRVDDKRILDENIAVFHENTPHPRTPDLMHFTAYLNHALVGFTKPLFFFFHFYDRKQKILGQMLAHTVAFYIPSPDQLHFFDANTGLFIANLSKNIHISQLHDIVTDLVFKKFFAFRWFINPDSESLIYKFQISQPYPAIDPNAKVRNCLLSYIENTHYHDMAIQIDETLDHRLRKFLERSIFVIKTQIAAENSPLEDACPPVSYTIMLSMMGCLSTYYSTDNVLLSVSVGAMTAIIANNYHENIKQQLLALAFVSADEEKKTEHEISIDNELSFKMQ